MLYMCEWCTVIKNAEEATNAKVRKETVSGATDSAYKLSMVTHRCHSSPENINKIFIFVKLLIQNNIT